MQNLPDFVIGGAQKSGTTGLHHVMRRHPDVFVPARPQEIHFFDVDDNLKEGKSGLAAHFEGAPPQAIKAQTCPIYLFHPKVADRAARLIPGVSWVFILRDPVQRAYSHYWHQVKRGVESLTFEESIRQECERIRTDDSSWRAFSYAARGFYAGQLSRFIAAFGWECIYVMFLEEWAEEPWRELERLQSFLGLTQYPVYKLTERERNEARRPRSYWLQRTLASERSNLFFKSRRLRKGLYYLNTKGYAYPPMSNEAKHMLEEQFRPANEELRLLLGRSELPWQWT